MVLCAFAAHNSSLRNVVILQIRNTIQLKYWDLTLNLLYWYNTIEIIAMLWWKREKLSSYLTCLKVLDTWICQWGPRVISKKACYQSHISVNILGSFSISAPLFYFFVWKSSKFWKFGHIDWLFVRTLTKLWNVLFTPCPQVCCLKLLEVFEIRDIWGKSLK